MEQGLFKKHIQQLNKQKLNKNEAISYIQEISGILLEEKDFTISKNKIKLNVSSVLQTKLLKKSVIIFLQTKGYTIT